MTPSEITMSPMRSGRRKSTFRGGGVGPGVSLRASARLRSPTQRRRQARSMSLSCMEVTLAGSAWFGNRTDMGEVVRHCALLAILGLVGCSGVVVPELGSPLSVTRFHEAGAPLFNTAVDQSERRVIRDQNAWFSAWGSLLPPNASVNTPPAVDFSKEMLIFVALGRRPSGGYAISVDSAKMTSSGITIWIGTVSPGSRCNVTAALTAPVDIARMQRIDTPVNFVDVPTVLDCSSTRAS